MSLLSDWRSYAFVNQMEQVAMKGKSQVGTKKIKRQNILQRIESEGRNDLILKVDLSSLI